ncbi:hypothetical protein GCK32_009016, partial [Trichostrongylus colubriformis]
SDDYFIRRVWTVFYVYMWYLSPFLIALSLIYYYPSPPVGMHIVALVIKIGLLLPTVILGIMKVLDTLKKMRNLSILFAPEHELWGPRMTDDRRKAIKMEKKKRWTYWWNYKLFGGSNWLSLASYKLERPGTGTDEMKM